MTLYIGFFLHIYQPPTQKPEILKKICKESYEPMIQLLLENPDVKITLNINGSLVELLNFYQEYSILNGIQTLVERKQIELVGSSCYHAILPLIPKEEIIRQIELNEEIQCKILGENIFQPSGFWLPEMAYEFGVLGPLIEKGYKWTVISSVATTNGDLPENYIPYVDEGFQIYFRNDLLSNFISFKHPTVEQLYKQMTLKKDITKNDYYVILAMDGETFGHHVKGLIESLLKPLIVKVKNDNNLDFVKISELPEIFKEKKKVSPVPSSWSTSAEDLQKGVPFPLWADPENKIHDLQKTIMNHAVFLIGLAQKYYNSTHIVTKDIQTRFLNARSWLDKGLHSCQLWWASGKPWYSSEMILKGLNQLILASAEALKVILLNSPNNLDKEKAMKIFDEIFIAQKEIFLLV
ncbi:MAG: hypothetical protein EAX90_09010 [Candidatus Heimdallarchaeota archaeon]|nr:hypothetical protein [Candidatus Heimdallarchaeota archaeon]